jgi:hypothetical protein
VACFGALPLAAVAVAGVGPVTLLTSLVVGGGYLAGAVALRRPLSLDALAALRRAPADSARPEARPEED